MTGYHFSLPTEAEWEYAARGGNKSTNAKYSGSSIVNAVAWYFFKGDFQPNSVGKLRPNELGIYDMSGNVWEWCQDWMGNYKSTNQTDPIESKESTERIIVQGTGRIIREGTERILRGGCYISEANECRVTNRGSMPPDYTNTFIGFRIVLH